MLDNDLGKKTVSMKNKAIVASTIVLLVILSGLYFYISSKNTIRYSEPNQFLFKSVQNKLFHIKTEVNHIKIEEFKGKIVFLKVFGWDCQYCRKEIPELIELKKKFEVAFDSIAIEEQHHTHKENMDFIKKLDINYNIVEGDKQTKFLDYLKKNYGWNVVIPLTIVIDAHGKILAFEVGYKSYNLTTLLQTTLNELTQVASPK